MVEPYPRGRYPLDEAGGERDADQLQLEEALGDARAALGRFQRDPVALPDGVQEPLAEPRP